MGEGYTGLKSGVEGRHLALSQEGRSGSPRRGRGREGSEQTPSFASCRVTDPGHTPLQ